MNTKLFINTITTTVIAKFIVILEILDNCKTVKFWLFLWPWSHNGAHHWTKIPVHAGQAALLESGLEEMHHSPYSPKLATSDYHVFPNFKKHLCGQRFLTND